jgi:tryptophan-rich hypothetical protein
MNKSTAEPARHRLNPGKLLLSKWTAVQPQNREKHFLVSELFCDEQSHVLQIELQAVLSQRCQRLGCRDLFRSSKILAKIIPLIEEVLSAGGISPPEAPPESVPPAIPNPESLGDAGHRAQ